MNLPARTSYLIVGAGIHGLSTAYFLARELKRRGEGRGEDIVVVDKSGAGAGASGIACGVIRNSYFQPAMGDLMRASVEIWEEHAAELAYHPVGYLVAAPEAQAPDLESIYDRHRSAGYRASLVRGESKCREYMRSLFPDWRAPGVAAVLHEHQGGFAFNLDSVRGLARLAASEGVRILSPVEVTAFDVKEGEVRSILTDRGEIRASRVILAAGPWTPRLWGALGLPERIDVRSPEGELRRSVDMWTYWHVREGGISFPPHRYSTASGEIPPVVHLDSTHPLYSDRDGRLITAEPWGIYFKRDRRGIQGGGVPRRVGRRADVDPYGHASERYTVGEEFMDYWTSGLAHCLGRFTGTGGRYRRMVGGGIGAFTADSFPVFDYMLKNTYVIADSNHGYKMIGVGREVAKVLLGEESAILRPFRFSRYTEGDLHPASHSPFPWS